MNNLEQASLSQICRTCKCVTPYMRSVFEGYETPHTSPRIDEMLMACASVQVASGDGLPAQMCKTCVEQLRSSYLFKCQCEKIDASFRQYEKKVSQVEDQTNQIKEEPQSVDFMGDSVFLCYICNCTFNRADSLEVHKKTHDNQQPKLPTFENLDHITDQDNTMAFSDHSNNSDMQDCFEPQIEVTESMDEDKINEDKSRRVRPLTGHGKHPKKFLCSECGQGFIRKDYLVVHLRRHRGDRPYKCKFCGKGFPRSTDLRLHERYHTGEKTHLCTVCGKGFKRAYALTVHMRTHTGEKPYQCTYCEAAFAQGNDLKAHVRRHTGERFHCELCSEGFLMGYLLTQHKRTVHGLNIVSNIRRLQPEHKTENSDDPPPVSIPLPKPVIPDKARHKIATVRKKFSSSIYQT